MASLRQLREARGLTQVQLAEGLGKSQSEIARLERGERRMTVDWAIRLAPLLGIEPRQLFDELTGPSTGAVRRSDQPSEPPAPPGLIPIMGSARGGAEQQMFLEDGPIGHTARPANLANVRQAYAIYVVGDSMEPRYEQGWLLHVNPFKPLKRGRDVVVVKNDQSVLIKRFEGWTEEELVLFQLNPQGEIRLRRADIRSCHLVVGCDQEG